MKDFFTNLKSENKEMILVTQEDLELGQTNVDEISKEIERITFVQLRKYLDENKLKTSIAYRFPSLKNKLTKVPDFHT